jgi:hypothetical protein
MDNLKSLNARVDTGLFRRVKVAAIQKDVRISDIVSESLLEWLERNEERLSKALIVTSEGSPTGA